MNIRIFSLICVSVILFAGCASKSGTQDAGSNQKASEPAPAPKPVVSCVPIKAKAEPSAKPGAKPATKSKTASKASVSSSSVAAPSEPLSPNAEGLCPAGYDRVVTQPEPAASKAAAENDPSKPQMVKSIDGSFEGEVYGGPAAGSKLARARIGMTELELKKVAGIADDVRSYTTGKAFIPFYHGSDASRMVHVYLGSGSVEFDLMGNPRTIQVIHHDPKIR